MWKESIFLIAGLWVKSSTWAEGRIGDRVAIVTTNMEEGEISINLNLFDQFLFQNITKKVLKSKLLKIQALVVTSNENYQIVPI